MPGERARSFEKQREFDLVERQQDEGAGEGRRAQIKGIELEAEGR